MSELLKNNKGVMKCWNYEKNKDVDLNKLTCGSHKKVWWKCSNCGYEWEAAINNRIKGTGCPKCALNNIGKNRINSLIKKNGSLAENNSDLAKEWDYEKNKNLTPNDVTCGSHKKVWWKCKKGHE